MGRIKIGTGWVILIIFIISCNKKTQEILQQPQVNLNQAEISQISDKINLYFEGWMTVDTTKLGRAMHTTCQLKNLKDGKVIIYDRSTYLGFFKPRPRRQNAGGRIVKVDVTGYTASAKCEIYTADRLYTDYFNMMKEDGEWYIVDKIASSKLKDINSKE